MKRGRPKGRSQDKKSYGPLGDLMRSCRLRRQMGLADVAKACKCSVQFISNIEHGRAPLPWDKGRQLAKVLEIPFEELQAANLAVRSDFQSFVGGGNKSAPTAVGSRVKKSATALNGLKNAASLVALTAKDPLLRDFLEQYQAASITDRKRLLASAKVPS